MECRVIDRDTWPPKEYLEHYLQNVPCPCSLTTRLDITDPKARRQKLYPALLCFLAVCDGYHVSHFINGLQEAGPEAPAGGVRARFFSGGRPCRLSICTKRDCR